MGNRDTMDGWIVLGAGLLLSSVSLFLEHRPILGTATDTATGFFDGLATVAYCVAIFVLVRSRRRTRQ